MDLLHDLRTLSAGFGRVATTWEQALALTRMAQRVKMCWRGTVHGYSASQLLR